MTAKISDQMILRIGQGNADAFAELYEEARAGVYGFALTIVKNAHEAEDIMQETFIKVYHAADTYQPQGKPMAWILTITRNLCMSQLRSAKHHEDIDEIHHMLEAQQEDPLDGLILEQALSILDDVEREIVLLHSQAGLKHREIAQILEIPLSTVLSKYHRSLKKMKKEMERAGV